MSLPPIIGRPWRSKLRQTRIRDHPMPTEHRGLVRFVLDEGAIEVCEPPVRSLNDVLGSDATEDECHPENVPEATSIA
jgi:hypothetical protein